MWRIDIRYFALIAAFVIIPATIFRTQSSDYASEDSSEVSEMIERQVENEVIKHVRALQLKGKQVYPPVKTVPASMKKRILVTGGAGFVGSHLVDRLMSQGHQVFVMDNFFTGSQANIVHWMGHPNFQLIMHDVTEPLRMEVDQIYHLACPASPPHYQVPTLFAMNEKGCAYHSICTRSYPMKI
jgi:FlaA1/EpsC-like NDP-sugar epimerase